MTVALLRNGAQAPAPETAASRGLGGPGSRTAAVDPAELAGLLRGEARVCDGAALALALARRLGLSEAATLKSLPAARALGRRAFPVPVTGA